MCNLLSYMILLLVAHVTHLQITFTLSSSLMADNVELTSSKQQRFTCPGEQVIFTCRVFGSVTLEWRSPLVTQPTVYLPNDRPPRIFTPGLFTAALINVSTNGTNVNTNFTSTLQVTASRMIRREATTVMCLSTSANETDNFTVAGEYCATLEISGPAASSSKVEQPVRKVTVKLVMVEYSCTKHWHNFQL